MKFLDEAKIYIKSGNGGNGCVAFRREKYIEFGGPAGGNGGRFRALLIAELAKPAFDRGGLEARMQERRGEKIVVNQPDNEASALLRLADETFEEWYSAEDEEAYGDLRAL